MVGEAFDPRKDIRDEIGTDWIIDGQTESCILITKDDGSPIYIPMYMREEEAVECPALPYIVIDVLGIPAIPHNIRASVRQHTCLMQLDIKFNDLDGIDITSFGKKIADTIVDKTRDSQCSVTGIDFYNVINQGRLLVENRCEDVVLHWIMEMEATYNDAC